MLLLGSFCWNGGGASNQHSQGEVQAGSPVGKQLVGCIDKS